MGRNGKAQARPAQGSGTSSSRQRQRNPLTVTKYSFLV